MIQWQDIKKLNEDMCLVSMMDDMRIWDEERRSYVKSLAASLNGLTFEQVEGMLEKLDGGYHAYSFTVDGNDGKRYFRVNKSGTPGWDGISFTINVNGLVEEASVY